MTIYWGLNSIPELQGLPKDQQGQLWRAGQRATLRTLRGWAAYGIMAILYGIMFIVVTQYRLAGVPGGSGVKIVVAGLLGGLIWFIPHQVFIRATRPFLATLRAALESHPPAEDGSYSVPPAF